MWKPYGKSHVAVLACTADDERPCPDLQQSNLDASGVGSRKRFERALRLFMTGPLHGELQSQPSDAQEQDANSLVVVQADSTLLTAEQLLQKTGKTGHLVTRYALVTRWRYHCVAQSS